MNIINDEEFIATLPKDLHYEYKQLKKDIKEKDEKPSDIDIALKYDAIRKSKRHDEILNACIFPFLEKRSMPNLGYSFIQSSPLSELGVGNLDFLIYSKTDKVLIFGEVKGSIKGDTKPIIDQYKKRIKFVEENFGRFKERFPEVESCEYVLGVPSDYAINTAKAISRSKVNIILWQINTYEEEWTLCLSLLDPNSRQDIKVMHSNNALNKTLHNLPTSKSSAKIFFPESHPVIKMSLLTIINKSLESFSFDYFKELVAGELKNALETDIDNITHGIIDLAVNIGFVKILSEGVYKINSKYKQTDAQYKELETKWINYQIKKEKEQAVKLQLEEIQKRLLSKVNTLDP